MSNNNQVTLQSMPLHSTFMKATTAFVSQQQQQQQQQQQHHQEQHQEQERNPITAEDIQERKEFAIFLKILANHLSKTDPVMRRNLKGLVRHCTQKNREGHPHYKNLTRSLKIHLESLVGASVWQQCRILARCYILVNSSEEARMAKLI